MRLPEGGEEAGVDVPHAAPDQLVRDAEGVRAGPVEAQAVLAHGLVTALAHVVHDGLGGLHDLAGQRPRPLQVLAREARRPLEPDGPHRLLPSPDADTSRSLRARARTRESDL